jgi:hypothetical protein
VAFWLDFWEDVLDFAVRANDKCGPGNAHHFPAVHILFLYNAELLGDLLIGIGEEGKWQLELVLKFLLGFGRVGGDAKQHDAGFLNLFISIAESTGLDGASGSIGAGIEIEDDGLAAQGFQGDFVAVLILQSEVGSLIIDIHGSLFSR